MYNLGDKAIDLLRWAGTPFSSLQRTEAWEQVCTKYSEKAVIRKLEELATRGYTTYGGNCRGSWLTDKGRDALAEADDVSGG